MTVTRQQSSDADLSGLTASAAVSADGTFSALDIGTFSLATTSYTATVPHATTHVKLTPTVADAVASVTVDGTAVNSSSDSGVIALEVGANVITVRVTAEDGTTKDYTVTVTRQQSSDADLSGLTASAAVSADGTFSALDIGTFSLATTSYTATVPHATTHVKLTPTVADAVASVTVDGTAVNSSSDSGVIALEVGANVITVRVTAEDGTTKDYTVTVTRQQSSDADLSGLTASAAVSADGTFSALDIGTFSLATTSYTATVPHATTHVKLTPTVADAVASVTVDGTAVNSSSDSGVIALEVGANVITVRVTAEDGTTKDYTVTITREAASADLVNISTRAVVGIGDDVMIGGFIISNGPKRVLVQAQGPELANANIANALADPVLTVIRQSDSTELMMNDDWEDSQGQEVTDAWGGNPNLMAGSLSSAAILTLDPGSYTAKVEGKDGTTGVALVEVYDLDSADVPGDLVNISTRAVVGTGDDVMIGGFIISNGPKRVLVQAQGPELANAGLANALADPVLTVIRQSDSTELMMNDDWEDSQGQEVTDAWGGNPNLMAGSLSSAAILTLDPGSYTAKVEGKDGTTGVALVEVYDLD